MVKSPKSYYVPMVLEQTPNGERGLDIYTRLLKDRIIILGSPIDAEIAQVVIAQMLFLQSEDPKKDIEVYINSPGGSVTDGLAIYDTMQLLSCDVKTYCMGQCASMGAVLLAAGSAGKRYALPSSRVMIHQPWGGANGSAADIEIQAKEINRLKSILNGILASHSGKSIDAVSADTDRDFFMSAEEAQAYGLIDHVLTFKKKR